MSVRVPMDKPAQVAITLKDGRTHVHTVSSHKGDFHEPYSEAQLRGKFRDLAGDVLTPEGIRRLEDAIDRCEHLHAVSDLAAIVKSHQKRT